MREGIDDLDKKIIHELQEDARRHFRSIACKLKFSEGTIRGRVKRLVKKNILKLEGRVNPFALPHKITALVGVFFTERFRVEKMKEIEKIPNITSVWTATGRYDLFFEVMVDSLQELDELFFMKGLKGVDGISRTETFIAISSNTKYLKLP